jgi:hypothetical protein
MLDGNSRGSTTETLDEATTSSRRAASSEKLGDTVNGGEVNLEPIIRLLFLSGVAVCDGLDMGKLSLIVSAGEM